MNFAQSLNSPPRKQHHKTASHKIKAVLLSVGIITSVLFVSSAQALVESETETPKALSHTEMVDQATSQSADAHKITSNSDGTLRVPSPMQDVIATITPAGATFLSDADDEGGGEFALRAHSIGRLQGPSSEVLPGSVGYDEQTARIFHPNLVEEFTTSAEGIRQDFVVPARPTGFGELVLELTVEGAKVAASDVGVSLTLTSGRELAYHSLLVVDANGETLPARFDVVSAKALNIVVDDAGAAYPVRIDPTITDADWFSIGTAFPTVNGTVRALASDGAGNLYVGGSFSAITGIPDTAYIAQWNGSGWSALGSGMNGSVLALTWDGSNLYAGGNFNTVGGNAASYIAQWDGSSWSALGSGMNSSVLALAWDGSNLYAGGGVTTAGGDAASRIAQWDGSSWSGLGSGVNEGVTALVWNGGEHLYAGGAFIEAGSKATGYVAKAFVGNAAPVNTVLPVVSGRATVGGALSTTVGTWTDEDGETPTYSYQWYRADDGAGTNLAAIGSATTNSYTLTTSDAHKYIRVVVTADDGAGSADQRATSAYTAVSNSAPSHSVVPAITGTARVGSSLNASSGSWSDADGDSPSYSYQWYRADDNSGTGEAAIATATNSSYTLTTADAHKYLKVVVTADDGNGSSDQSAASLRTAVVNSAPANTALPVVSGSNVVGGVLNATSGSWSDADGDSPNYSYQWKSGSNAIGTNSSSYTLTASEAHTTITVVVTANDGKSGTASATSAGTVVTNTAPANSALPVISGNLVEGGALTTTDGGWSDTDGDGMSYGYQWRANGSAIGTNSSGYTLTGSEVGKAISVVVTASDGQGGSTSATSLVTAAVDTDLDGDGVGDAVDTDIDGDGIDNSWESANGLDPLDGSDASGDLDGDGVSNLDEFLASSDPNVDDNPPVVTPPADMSVNAIGLFTPVSVGTATASDALDGEVAATSDAPSHFSPGVTLVTWSASDATGNTGTATQRVNVTPMVDFSKDQITSEGSTVSFAVILNGEAVSYPVSVPYTVSGSADGSDHDLVSGVATISSGTEVEVFFNTVDDGAGEGGEQIVVTMGSPDNAVVGAKTSHTIEVVEGNVAPSLSLAAYQGVDTTFTVTQTDGSVEVIGSVIDPNVGDSHNFDWSLTDSVLFDTDGATDSFTFDPSALTAGLYTLRLTVDDGAASDSAEITLNLVATPPVLTTADSDGDSIDDLTEGYGDSDGDGVPDYLDAISASNVLQQQSGESSSYLMETDPGLRLCLGSSAFQTNNGEAEVSMADIANGGGVGDESGAYDYQGGLFDFTVDDLPAAGQSVNIVLAQFSPIPANAVYRKLVASQWQDFVVNANNSVASAAGEAGYCPPPGDAAYVSGLTEGDWCVQLTIEDGGPNDADGEANNRVVDPSGVAAVTRSVSSGGGGAVHPFWLFMLVLFMLYRHHSFVMRKRM